VEGIPIEDAMRSVATVALLSLAVAVLVPPLVAKEKDPPPAGCHWQSIPVLNARLAVPDGWQFRDTSTGMSLSYEVRPAGPGFENAKALYRLEVSRGNKKAEVVSKAKEFIESARASAATAESLERQENGALTVFSCSVTSAPDHPGALPVSTALSAAANSRTGTLYTVRFDVPSDEVVKVTPLGSQLLHTMRLDDQI
jgi:hypothetical protein